jgi:D-alanyl-D-alanine carboxypeptidase
MRITPFVTALLLSFSAHSVYGISEGDFSSQIEQYNYFTNSPATYATYCLADDCYSTAAGHTSFNRREAASPANLLSIGSNSKMITAILTLILADKGYLRLDDQLVDYFPEYDLWKGVTVRHLLQHASGVPPYLFSKDGVRRTILSVFNWQTRIWTPPDLVRIVAKQPLLYPPGTRVEYNNTNYVLLGMILQKAAIKPLATLLQTEIFGPLDMGDTYLTLLPGLQSQRVAGYFPMNIPLPDWLFNLVAHKVEKSGDYLETTRIFHDSMTWASGGMLSTTADLAKLLRALLTGNLVSPGLLAEMKDFREGTVLGFPFLYGLGLMRTPSAHGDLHGHGGLTPGYQSVSNYLAARDITLNLAQNLGPSQIYSVYFDLLDAVTQPSSYKEFIPAAEVSDGRLQDRAIHVRAYGKISGSEAPKSPFPRSFGYSKLRSNRYYATFQAFETRLITRDSKSVLTIEGSSGGSPLGGASTQNSKQSFVKVMIDRAALLAENASLFTNSSNTDSVFVYRGEKTTDAAGLTKECIYEVLDRSRPLAFQVDGQEGESFEAEQTLKFIGNIPLKKLSLTEIPKELANESVEICR